MLKKWIALLLVFCLAAGTAALGEGTSEEDWLTFLLICNEGMQNDGGNVRNTTMVVSMEPHVGKIRLAAFTWDTFIRYTGYDIPQLFDQPYRNAGPEATMQVFNENFGFEIDRYLSLNYLNLASLIDDFGGVTVDISRAERNALNGLVASKKNTLQSQAESGLLSQMIVELLAQEYYLNDYGPETHLNGMQGVAFGWLQYDSIYNCCQREIHVIDSLFRSVGETVGQLIAIYSNTSDAPDADDERRPINIDNVTEEDMEYLRSLVRPIFHKSANNLTEDEISAISLALVHAAYLASRQGQNIFEAIDLAIFPLEATEPYDYIANTAGHIVDYEANSAALHAFLYDTEE